MTGGREKICEIQDPEKLRAALIKGHGAEMSCAICCATSDDPEELCSPVKTPGTNLFCDL